MKCLFCDRDAVAKELCTRHYCKERHKRTHPRTCEICGKDITGQHKKKWCKECAKTATKTQNHIRWQQEMERAQYLNSLPDDKFYNEVVKEIYKEV